MALAVPAVVLHEVLVRFPAVNGRAQRRPQVIPEVATVPVPCRIPGVRADLGVDVGGALVADQIVEDGGLRYLAVGGAHATYRPHDFFEDSNDIDYAIRGEGEITILELIYYHQNHHTELKNIKGVTFRQKGTIIDNPPRKLIKDLNILPMPAIDLLPLEKYHVSPDNYLGERVGLITTT